MGQHINLCSILSLSLAGFVICNVPESDPCSNYTTLVDPTMDVSYTQITTGGTFLNGTMWYRYTNSGQSILASSCPTQTVCGTAQPVWMNGNIPSYTDGSALVDTCYKNATNCCVAKGRVRVKNCKTYLVYMLTPLYGGYRWCFSRKNAIQGSDNYQDKALRALPSEEDSGLSLWVLVVIGAGSFLGLLLTIILIAVVRHQLKSSTVDPSTTNSNLANDAAANC